MARLFLPSFLPSFLKNLRSLQEWLGALKVQCSTYALMTDRIITSTLREHVESESKARSFVFQRWVSAR
jgi:hypothetical protein